MGITHVRQVARETGETVKSVSTVATGRNCSVGFSFACQVQLSCTSDRRSTNRCHTPSKHRQRHLAAGLPTCSQSLSYASYIARLCVPGVLAHQLTHPPTHTCPHHTGVEQQQGGAVPPPGRADGCVAVAARPRPRRATRGTAQGASQCGRRGQLGGALQQRAGGRHLSEGRV